MRKITYLLALAALLLPGAAAAQTEPTYKPGQGISDQNPQPVKNRCWNGTAWAACATGGGGGGTADSTAANQTAQIALEQAIRDEIGALTSPATGSTNNRLGLIQTTLGNPFQAGGSIGNTAFGITGPLPSGTNVIGTVNNTPIAYTSTTTAVTIAAAATYQSVLAANTARKGCLIMATSTTTATIRLGAPGTATATNVIPLAAGQVFSCANVNGTTIGDEISMATPAAGSTLLVINQ